MAPIVSMLFSGALSFFTRRNEIKAAEHIKKLEGLQSSEASEYLADKQRNEILASSWKSGYITLVVSLPVFLCFSGSEGAAFVLEGFKVLESTPEWYQFLFIGVFAVGAGVPLASKTIKSLKDAYKA